MWIGILVLVMSSCVPLKKTVYMQVRDASDTMSNFVNERDIDYRVQPGDNLYIRVVTLDEQITTLLNPLTNVRGGGNVGGGGDGCPLRSDCSPIDLDDITGIVEFIEQEFIRGVD